MTTKMPKTESKGAARARRVSKAVAAPVAEIPATEPAPPVYLSEAKVEEPVREKWQWSPAKHARFAARERFREFNQRTGTWLYKLSGVACFQRDVLAYLRSLEATRDGVTA